MSFESVVGVRNELFAALRADTAPDDQVMIVGTRGGNRTIAFTTDPVVLEAQVEALHWEAPTRVTEPDANDRRRTCMDAPGSENVLDVDFAGGSLAFITSAVSDLRSQPGRKIILLLADGINDTCPEYRWRFEERLRRLTDLASRTASIIYALQTRAFSSGVRMPDQRNRSSDVTGPPAVAVTHNEVSEWMKKLAEPTGGYADRANSMTVLVSAALKDASSYYALAYEPPPGTFTGGKVQYRRVQVRVSRRGAMVRTRAGFYSIADSELVSK
jgi:VWFA-related protein